MKRVNMLGIGVLVSLTIAGYFSVAMNSNDIIIKGEEEILQEKLEQRTDKKPLKLGVITDVHAYGKEVDGEWQINWRSKDAMLRFVDKMNKEFKPEAVVEIGDLIDGKDHNSLMDWKIMDGMMKKLTMPYFNTTGNHEMRAFEKAVWMEMSGQQRTYYYNDINGYRIIILDGNHFGNGHDTTPEKEKYAGSLGGRQLKWLEAVLKNAIMKDRDPVVFVHQPPVETDARGNWQLFPRGVELHRLFDKYKVRASFSGHIERLCDMKADDEYTEYFVLQGMWKENKRLKEEARFKDAGNFYYVTIEPNNISVEMEYRIFNPERYKTERTKGRIKGWERILINKYQYNCQDGADLIKNNDNLGDSGG